MKKTLILLGILMFTFGPSSASALTAEQIQSIITLVRVFGADESTLRNVEDSLYGRTPTQRVPTETESQAFCYTFARNLRVGIGLREAEADALGTILLKEGLVSSSNINEFDEDVAAAVIDFQAKYGIRKTGTIGPLTRGKLNQLYGCSSGRSVPLPVITPLPTPVPVPPTIVYPPPRQPVQVLSPNGGEVWQTGQTYTISYNLPSSDDAALVYLQTYHPDGSPKAGQVNSSTLIASPAKGVQSVRYTVPDYLAEQVDRRYKIKVCTVADKCYSQVDYSDGFFAISSGTSSGTPSITVLYPNGGETLMLGVKDVDFRTEWSSSNLSGRVEVYLQFLDGGGCKIGTAPVSSRVLTATLGTNYQCPGPGIQRKLTAGQYKVFLRADNNNPYAPEGGEARDYSDSFFIITSGSTDTSRRESIRQLYLELLLREPDAEGLNYWDRGNLPLDSVRAGIRASYEYGVKKQINALYLELLGRDAEAAGMDYWYTKMYIYQWSIAQVRQGIMESEEYRNKTATKPVITSVRGKVADNFVVYAGEEGAEISGSSFGGGKMGVVPRVRLNGIVDATVTQAGDTLVWFTVPLVSAGFYDLTVTTDRGTSAPVRVQVRNSSASPPSISEFRISHPITDTTRSTTLVWNASNAQGCTLNGPNFPAHAPYSVSEAISTGILTADSTYQLTCTSASGASVSRSLFIGVLSAPTTQPSITVFSPNGTESYKQGDIIPIRWQSQGISVNDTLIFDILNANRSAVHMLDNGLNTGSSFVPSGDTAVLVPGQYYIRLRYLQVSDISDTPFTITTPAPQASVTLVSPNGGDTLEAGKGYVILWNAQNIDQVRIFLTNQTGTETQIAPFMAASLGRYSWLVPADTAPGQYKIRLDGPALGDSSDSYFTIAAPATGIAIFSASSLSASSAAIGAEVKLYTSGIPVARNSPQYFVEFNNQSDTPATIDGNGTFTFKVPNLTPGNYAVSASVYGADASVYTLIGGRALTGNSLPFTITAPTATTTGTY